jgi:dihydrofolate reductase
LTVGNKKNAIVMGRNTWESIKVPLSKRDNLILSNTIKLDFSFISNNINNLVKTFTDIKYVIKFCKERQYDELWIIGGTKIYEIFLNSNDYLIDEIYISYLDNIFNCDTFFPKIPENKYKFVSNSVHNSCNDNYIIYDKLYVLI